MDARTNPKFHRALYKVLWGAGADFAQANAEVRATFEKYAAGAAITARTTLETLINPKVVSAAFQWLGFPAAEPPRIEIPPPAKPVLSLTEVITAFKNWLYLPDPSALKIILGATAANLMPGDPLWLLLVGAPGSGKTELVDSLLGLERLLGKCVLFDLTEDRIHTYIRPRTGEGAGGRTINMEVGELSRALKLKWSVTWPGVRKLEENHDVGRALLEEEEYRLLNAAAHDNSPNRNPSLYPFLQTALLTGMRDGEMKTLRWIQIEFERGVITVGRKAKTKASSGREIPMNPELRMVLEQHAAWYIEKFGEIRPEWHVFPGRKGRPQKGVERAMDPTVPLGSIAKAWDTLRQRAGVKCRFHDLRHTYCTKMAENDVPESTMKSILGHMSQAMLERYSHIRMKAKREAVAGIKLAKPARAAAETGESLDSPTKVPTKVAQSPLLQ
jgi:site-specific recombinase XerD